MAVHEPNVLLWTIDAFAFAFGAAWGSFLNVVIYRLPLGLSLVAPGSFCPRCETPIKPYDNVPLLGWLWLRGRCRSCAAPISPRYPLVELLVALLSLALAVKVFHGRIGTVVLGDAPIFELLVPYLLLFAFVCALVALFFIDIDRTELPPEITVPGIAVGLLTAWAVAEGGLVADLTPNVSLGDAALGAVIGGGVILLLIVGYYLLTGGLGMGGGDIWMMAMVGAFVGWQGLLFVYLASSVQGLAVAFGAMAWAKVRGGDGREAGVFRTHEVAALEREMGLRDHEAGALGAAPQPSGQGALAEESAAPSSDSPAAAFAPSAEPSSPEPRDAQDVPGSEDSEDALHAGEPTDAEPTDAEPTERVGKLAIPFGPFIAVSALEYIFLGEILVPLLTGGVLSPHGFLL